MHNDCNIRYYITILDIISQFNVHFIVNNFGLYKSYFCKTDNSTIRKKYYFNGLNLNVLFLYIFSTLPDDVSVERRKHLTINSHVSTVETGSLCFLTAIFTSQQDVTRKHTPHGNCFLFWHERVSGAVIKPTESQAFQEILHTEICFYFSIWGDQLIQRRKNNRNGLYSRHCHSTEHSRNMKSCKYWVKGRTPSDILYRVIRNVYRGFNNLSYTIHLR